MSRAFGKLNQSISHPSFLQLFFLSHKRKKQNKKRNLSALYLLLTMTASPSTHQPRRRRNVVGSVSFSMYATVRSTIALQDYTDAEISATWYSREDYQVIQKSMVREVLRLDEGMIFKDRKYCSLGLHGFTKVGSQTKKAIRYQAAEAVLDEQDRQFLDEQADVIDDVAIAEAYKAVSQKCRLWASAMGLANQRAVSATTTVNCPNKTCTTTTTKKENGNASVGKGRCYAMAECFKRSPVQRTGNQFIHMEKARSA